VKNYLILFIAFIIFSCGKEKTPEGLLSEDKMVNMLIDIHMVEGFVSSFPIHYDSSAKLYPMLEKRVFDQHQVADSVFKESLEYYLKDVRAMNRIYDRVIDTLSMREKVGEQ